MTTVVHILQDIQETNPNPEDLQVICTEVEYAIQSLKGGKSPEVDSVQVELIKGGRKKEDEGFYHTLLKDLGNQAFAMRRNTASVLPQPKKDKVRQC